MTDPETNTAPSKEPAAEETKPAATLEKMEKMDPLAAAPSAPAASATPVSVALVSSRPMAPSGRPVASAMAAPASPAFSIAGYAFADENAFLGDVGRAILGAAGGALVAHTINSGSLAGDNIALFLTMAVSGALAAVGSRTGGLMRGIISAVFGLLGGFLYAQSTPQWPFLGAILMGLAAAPVLARGESGTKMAATGLLTGLLVALGAYVSHQLGATGVLETLVPKFLATSAAGGVLGLFVGLGGVPRYITRGEEPVEGAYTRALSAASGEVHEILERSLLIYRAIRDDLAARQTGRTEIALTSRVSDLAMRILKIGEQCRSIERDLGDAPAQALEDRIAALQAKADAATDATARATFLATIASLDSQRKAVEAIGRGLERVVARLHANVALLEKVRFSLVHARSADAERSGDAASPLTDTIDELSRELDATSTAVGEVYGAKEPA